MKVVLAAIAIATLIGAWIMDHRSVERGNRLYREGAFQEAAAVYRDRQTRSPVLPQVQYNFGTALLGMRNEQAREVLGSVRTQAADETQIRALYNLGVWYLTRALSAGDLASARANAVEAIAANRSALRLQPGREDASWNLSIALQLLASIDAGEDGPRSFVKGAAPPDEPPELQQKDELQEGPPAGADETAANAAELAPLSLSEASEVLGTGHRDPTTMVGKLMALEGRTLRARARGQYQEVDEKK